MTESVNRCLSYKSAMSVLYVLERLLSRRPGTILLATADVEVRSIGQEKLKKRGEKRAGLTWQHPAPVNFAPLAQAWITSLMDQSEQGAFHLVFIILSITALTEALQVTEVPSWNGIPGFMRYGMRKPTNPSESESFSTSNSKTIPGQNRL